MFDLISKKASLRVMYAVYTSTRTPLALKGSPESSDFVFKVKLYSLIRKRNSMDTNKIEYFENTLILKQKFFYDENKWYSGRPYRCFG